MSFNGTTWMSVLSSSKVAPARIGRGAADASCWPSVLRWPREELAQRIPRPSAPTSPEALWTLGLPALLPGASSADCAASASAGAAASWGICPGGLGDAFRILAAAASAAKLFSLGGEPLRPEGEPVAVTLSSGCCSFCSAASRSSATVDGAASAAAAPAPSCDETAVQLPLLAGGSPPTPAASSAGLSSAGEACSLDSVG
mmetsp:Transcript_39006/g.98774  ORF Transcript_39006/g.98774 Transcript_39006/m.98774 type:complete len:201 (+) Transcript_39006:176-778(+)